MEFSPITLTLISLLAGISIGMGILHLIHKSNCPYHNLNESSDSKKLQKEVNV